MKLTRMADRFLLLPDGVDDRQIIDHVLELAVPGQRLHSGWCDIDKRNGRKCIEQLNVGGKQFGDDFIGGFTFWLRGTTLADAEQVGRIRDICFMGTGVYFVDVTADGESGIYLGGGPCVECGGPTIGPGAMSLRHSLCDECAKSCPHDYKPGIYSGTGGIGMAGICTLCNRIDPDSIKVPAEQINQITGGKALGKIMFMPGATLEEVADKIVEGLKDNDPDQN